jgi:hypothetical protein
LAQPERISGLSFLIAGDSRALFRQAAGLQEEPREGNRPSCGGSDLSLRSNAPRSSDPKPTSHRRITGPAPAERHSLCLIMRDGPGNRERPLEGAGQMALE